MDEENWVGGKEAIPLPKEALESLAEAQRKLQEGQAQINSYVSGLRHGLKVPEGWKLDMQARAFVPSSEEEGKEPGQKG